MAVLAIVDDLAFRSKMEAASAHLGVELDVAAALPEVRKNWRLAIIDLNLANGDPLEIIRSLKQQLPAIPLVGYGSHVQTELMASAHAAGCDQVLPRSAFVQRLPELLQGY